MIDGHDELWDAARAARQRDDLAEAERLARELVARDPGRVEAQTLLGEVLIALERYGDAAVALRCALAVAPEAARTHGRLATAFLGARRFEEAVEAARAAAALDGSDVDPYLTLGVAALELDRFRDAIEAYRCALALAPANADVWYGLAHALHLLGEYDAETNALGQALALRPALANAHSNLGVTLLLRGELARGWEEYLWYLRSPANRKSVTHPYLDRVPLWDGAPFPGRRLVIARDQAFGDFVQMMRYFPHVKALGGTVVVEVAPALERLAAGAAGIDELRVVSGVTRPLPAADVHVPLMSLPRTFGTTLETIPAAVSYLRADPALVARWEPRLRVGPAARLRVGIAWSGNVVHVDDRHRSSGLAAFAALAPVDGVAWFALQKGRDETPAGAPRCLRLLGPEIADFADLAAIVAQLDLVVTVDTALAHVAGALGKPVWTLLPFVPDWRWMLAREDSPWYPTMRLFRQDRTRRWGPVFDAVATELARVVATRAP